MANDFEVPGPSDRGAASNDRFSERERMQNVRRHIREQQDRHSRTAQRKKAQEQELAMRWKEKCDRDRAQSRETLQAKLAHLEKQRLRAKQRAADALEAAEASARPLSHVPTGTFSECGAARPPDALADSFASGSSRPRQTALPAVDPPAVAREHRPRPAERSAERSAERRRAGGGGGKGQQAAQAKASKEEQPVARRCSSSWALPWENTDSKKQELGVHALVRAMMSGQYPQQSRQDQLSPRDKLAADADNREEEDEEETQLDPKGQYTALQKTIARKRRLKMMHVVAGEVLQCRQDMAGAFQHAFAVH